MLANARPAIAGAALLVALAGCSAEPTPQEPANPESGGQQPCQVGYWLLDVPDYRSQSEAYMVGLGIPLEEYTMTGDGNLDIGADGFIAGVISLDSSGVFVAEDRRAPFETHSSSTFSGNWELGADASTIDLSNWVTVPDPAVEVEPGDPPVSALDFTDIPSVSAECTGDTLRLQVPDAPLSVLFHRE